MKNKDDIICYSIKNLPYIIGYLQNFGKMANMVTLWTLSVADVIELPSHQ